MTFSLYDTFANTKGCRIIGEPCSLLSHFMTPLPEKQDLVDDAQDTGYVLQALNMSGYANMPANLKCSMCDMIFPYKSSLKRHLGAKHDLPCSVCDKIFSQKNSLIRHLETMHGIKRLSCQFCDKVFAYKWDLDVHTVKEHMGGDSNRLAKLTCFLCGKIFAHKEAVNKHLKTVHGNKEFTCRLCDKAYTSKWNLDCHTEKKHSYMLGDTTCSQCDKIFPHKYSLIRHIETVHKKKRLPCQYCDKVFANKWNLNGHTVKEHMRDDLRNLAKFTCSMCGKVFSQTGNLTEHLLRVHGGKRYPCQLCDKQFGTNFNLKRHRMKHHQKVHLDTITTLHKDPIENEDEEVLSSISSAKIPKLVKIGSNDQHVKIARCPRKENGNEAVDATKGGAIPALESESESNFSSLSTTDSSTGSFPLESLEPIPWVESAPPVDLIPQLKLTPTDLIPMMGPIPTLQPLPMPESALRWNGSLSQFQTQIPIPPNIGIAPPLMGSNDQHIKRARCPRKENGNEAVDASHATHHETESLALGYSYVCLSCEGCKKSGCRHLDHPCQLLTDIKAVEVHILATGHRDFEPVVWDWSKRMHDRSQAAWKIKVLKMCFHGI